MQKGLIIIGIWTLLIGNAISQNLTQYNVAWNSSSANSSESMPCGGGDIGLNVWVEKGDILFYFGQSGSFDEHNTLLKTGRTRIQLNPNPFESEELTQTLDLATGRVIIKSTKQPSTTVIIWVEVFQPVIHVDIDSKEPLQADVRHENWRFEDRLFKSGESRANSYKWAAPDTLKTLHDKIAFDADGVLFYHQNTSPNVFDLTVHQQGLDGVKNQMFNPLINLITGGWMYAPNMKPGIIDEGDYNGTSFKSWQLVSKHPDKEHRINIYLNTKQVESLQIWRDQLKALAIESDKNIKSNRTATLNWWKQYWSRSYININAPVDSEPWKIARNYQLFRYMLGCNAYGQYPTKFNGGLFTSDPSFVDKSFPYTPDFRNWGGGTMTAQNQRLVYWPLLRSGDFDMMPSQFKAYMQMLRNAELRSEVYWNHKGACFTEQIENFGLPNCTEYGWKRPDNFDKGLEYNAWLEYQWDTVLEFCLMMIENNRYNNTDIKPYIPFIESCLRFFDEHYTYLAKQRGIKELDENSHLILYPGSGCETYKMAYNSTSTIAGLKSVLTALTKLYSDQLSASQTEYFNQLLKKIPPITLTQKDGKTMISPAKHWERVQNTESSQLYPVFPWGIYGIGQPDLQTAINTYQCDSDAIKFKSHVGWKQNNIWAARLGLTDEAKNLALLKLADSGRRFPAFWGPGFDYVPDHNWGGSGMIGLQEMLMQTVDDAIYLFPAWPKDWGVTFKLHAPKQTTVECSLKNGKIEWMKVEPAHRTKDVVTSFAGADL